MNHKSMNMVLKPKSLSMLVGRTAGDVVVSMFHVNSGVRTLYRYGDCVCLVLAKINQWVL